MHNVHEFIMLLTSVHKQDMVQDKSKSRSLIDTLVFCNLSNNFFIFVRFIWLSGSALNYHNSRLTSEDNQGKTYFQTYEPLFVALVKPIISVFSSRYDKYHPYFRSSISTHPEHGTLNFLCDNEQLRSYIWRSYIFVKPSSERQ